MTLDRATFEQARNELVQRRAAIDRLIGALDVLLADDELMSPRIAVAPEKSPQPEPRTPKVDPDEWADRRARAQTMYLQGTGPQEICDTLNVSIRRVDKWIQRGKWRQQKLAILQEAAGESTQPPVVASPAPPLPAAATDDEHPAFDPDAESKAKAMFIEGTTVRQIAAAIDRPMQTIYTWSSRGQWGRERELSRLAKAKKTASSTALDPVAERIRAQRRAADDAIIEQVRQEVSGEMGQWREREGNGHLNGRHHA